MEKEGRSIESKQKNKMKRTEWWKGKKEYRKEGNDGWQDGMMEGRKHMMV